METTVPRWEHFEHQADMGVRGMGRSPAEAFVQAALALTAVVTDPAQVRTTQSVQVFCEAADYELLLVEWLNAVIYQMAIHRMIFGSFRVRLEGMRLQGELVGETVDVARHEPAVEVKGTTFTALKVSSDANGVWIAQCVVDV